MKTIQLKPIISLSDKHIACVESIGISRQGLVSLLVNKNRNKKETTDLFYDIYTYKNGIENKIMMKKQKLKYCFIVYLDNDAWLLADSRSRYIESEKKGTNNIKVVDKNTNDIAEYCFGDGIAKIVHLNGNIWTSYFDEGVFGNGWDEPIGQSGLVCWNIKGEKKYEYNPPEELGPIDDCYAMNTDGHSIYIQYYSDFPFVKIDANFNIKKINIEINGSDFAIHNNYLLFKEAYKKNNELHLFELISNEVKFKETYSLYYENSPFNNFGSFSNGKYMVVYKEDKLFCLDLENLV